MSISLELRAPSIPIRTSIESGGSLMPVTMEYHHPFGSILILPVSVVVVVVNSEKKGGGVHS